jgi:hypothetical protein
MRWISALLVIFAVAIPNARAGCDWLDRLCYSAASPGYPAEEFWAPRLHRLHICHCPKSVSVFAPPRSDATPAFIPIGPPCSRGQPKCSPVQP